MHSLLQTTDGVSFIPGLDAEALARAQSDAAPSGAAQFSAGEAKGGQPRSDAPPPALTNKEDERKGFSTPEK